MGIKLVAIVRNHIIGGIYRICEGEDGKYLLQDGYTLYKMKYNVGDAKFDPIDFLKNAIQEEEVKITFKQLCELLLNNTIRLEEPMRFVRRYYF